jgi:hypothetical protein
MAPPPLRMVNSLPAPKTATRPELKARHDADVSRTRQSAPISLPHTIRIGRQRRANTPQVGQHDRRIWPEYGAAPKWLAESRVRAHLLKTGPGAAKREFFRCNRVDMKRSPEYIPPTGAPHCPGVMARLSKHLTCNSEPSFRSVVGGRIASTVFVAPGLRGWGFQAPGCLKSESEERETWTAESLRAASKCMLRYA